ncbi:unnamed protein product [Larinioides sclopetarius]|uniref:Uncharacterized protein n=1 Tax=Larinioides sclopetarius TaxID=280406 RepID=A0AAV1ZDD5_9ARAC
MSKTMEEIIMRDGFPIQDFVSHISSNQKKSTALCHDSSLRHRHRRETIVQPTSATRVEPAPPIFNIGGVRRTPLYVGEKDGSTGYAQ